MSQFLEQKYFFARNVHFDKLVSSKCLLVIELKIFDCFTCFLFFVTMISVIIYLVRCGKQSWYRESHINHIGRVGIYAIYFNLKLVGNGRYFKSGLKIIFKSTSDDISDGLWFGSDIIRWQKDGILLQTKQSTPA